MVVEQRGFNRRRAPRRGQQVRPDDVLGLGLVGGRGAGGGTAGRGRQCRSKCAVRRRAHGERTRRAKERRPKVEANMVGKTSKF